VCVVVLPVGAYEQGLQRLITPYLHIQLDFSKIRCDEYLSLYRQKVCTNTDLRGHIGFAGVPTLTYPLRGRTNTQICIRVSHVHHTVSMLRMSCAFFFNVKIFTFLKKKRITRIRVSLSHIIITPCQCCGCLFI